MVEEIGGLLGLVAVVVIVLTIVLVGGGEVDER